MKRRAIMIGCALICFGATNCRAQDFLVKNPGITGIAVAPVNANQCLPVRISFTLANTTDMMMYSQRPYSGDGYNLYQSFQGSGMEVLPDRYMVGVSLNDGQDGYPYRWGFRGALPPGSWRVSSPVCGPSGRRGRRRTPPPTAQCGPSSTPSR